MYIRTDKRPPNSNYMPVDVPDGDATMWRPMETHLELMGRAAQNKSKMSQIRMGGECAGLAPGRVLPVG
jgi:hypothetical protein